jgi:PhnB protein
MILSPYISFNGNCEEALNFYARALNGKIKDLSRFSDTPAPYGDADKNKVMHSTFEADGFSFMASDIPSGMPAAVSGSNVNLSLHFDDLKQEEQVFNALGEGGKITMPLQETFWGAKFGMLEDKFGLKWMFNCELKK